MSLISDHSSSPSSKEAKFALQTRLVVYNFLGLVPTQEVEDEDDLMDTARKTMDCNCSSSEETPWNLSSLPPVSLIEKLKDSEEHFAKNRLVCDELVKKFEKVIVNSPSIEKQRKSKLSQEDLHKSLLQEIQMRGSTKSNCSGSTEERLFKDSTNIRQMTVIKKRENLKVIFDSSKLYAQDGSKPSNSPQVDKKSNPLSDFDDRLFFEQNPGNLLSECMAEFDGSYDVSVSEACHQASGQYCASPGSHHSKRSYVRQVSGVSSSNRRCSTYVDINDVDDTTLASYKRLPPSTLPLKREISKAISQLESDYNQMQMVPPISRTSTKDDSTEDNMMTRSPGLFSSISLTSPESHVADRLRAIGDQLDVELGPKMEQIIGQMVEEFCTSGEIFSSVYMTAVGSLFSEIASGWNRVALILTTLQRLVTRLIEMGSPRISDVVELMASLLEEQNRDFILERGGWNTIADMDMVETSLPLNITEELGFDITDDVNVSAVHNKSHSSGCENNNAIKLNGRPIDVESPSGETTASQSSFNSQLFSSALNLAPSPIDNNTDDQGIYTEDISSTPLQPGSNESVHDAADELHLVPEENDHRGNFDWSRDLIEVVLERLSTHHVRNLIGFSVVVSSLFVLWKMLRRS